MPGLVKVGYSMKDPDLRAAELNHTGSPHPYIVEYEILIDGPYEIEQKSHKLLSPHREGKEWFRCSAEHAVAAIKRIAGTGIVETYKGAERAKVEALHQQEAAEAERKRADLAKARAHHQQGIIDAENKRKAEIAKAEALHQHGITEAENKRKKEIASKEIETRLVNEESALRTQHQRALEASFPPTSFWHLWIAGSVLGVVVVTVLLPEASNYETFILSVVFGSILGVIIHNHERGKKLKSNDYLALKRNQKDEIEAVRVRYINCYFCNKLLKFDRALLLLHHSAKWNCPHCKVSIFPPT